MELLVKFTDDTYQSLSNDTIMEWCALKLKVLTAQQKESVSGESSGRASL